MQSIEDCIEQKHSANCSNCFEVPADPLRPTNSKNPTLFFNDGKRSIDFVLVWKTKADEEAQQMKKRKVFEDNLLAEGLEIERETFEDLNFIKVICNIKSYIDSNHKCLYFEFVHSCTRPEKLYAFIRKFWK